MFKRIVIALAFLATLYAGAIGSREFVREAVAQNVTCATRPVSDNSNACASTAFVNAFVAAYTVVCSQLPAGVDCNTLRAITTADSLSSSDCRKTITLGGSASYTLTVGAASGFSSTCSIVIANTDTGRGKIMSIDGVSFPMSNILWPEQNFTLKNVNNTWVVFDAPSRWKFTSAVTLYVDTAAGNNANDGLAAGSGNAMASLAAAISRACTHFDINAQLIIQLTTGQTHPAQTLCSWSGNTSASSTNPIIQGDTTSCANAANYVIDGGASIGVLGVGVGTPWTIRGLNPTSTVGGTAVEADAHSVLYVGTNTVFTAVSGFHMRSFYLSFLEATGNYCINGAAVVHANAENQGQWLIQPGLTVTCSAGHAFTIFAQAKTNGLQTWTGTTFSGCGSVTGQRYTSETGAGINTNGGGASFLPGNAAGSATNPGWYN